MLSQLASTTTLYALATAIMLAGACAALSVLVVSRHWAFIGEGISHSGFGGAGTAWVLALVFPALDRPWVPYTCVIGFCLLMALAVGFLSHRQRMNSDAAIGIFMVASLAWGFLARSIYVNTRHVEPVGFDTFLFGQMGDLSRQYALMAIALSLVVMLVFVLFNKEILCYCYDAVMAEASGIRVGVIHYLLMLLMGITIILGVRVVGSVLVTALLVLPGATALTLSQKLNVVFILSSAVAIVGAIGGILVHLTPGWQFVPPGPAMVLILCLEFCVAYAWSKRPRSLAT